MEEKDYRRLRRKIIGAILGFSLIPLCALGITIYYQFSVSYTAKIIENLKSMAENRRSALDLFFDERISQLVTLAYTHTFAEVSDEAHLSAMFNTMQTRSKSFVDIGVIDQKGNHLAYVGPYPELKEVNYKKEDWFQSVLSKGVYVSDVFLGYRKFPHFIIAVLAREADRAWILRATINSEIIDAIVRAAQVGKKGDAFIINKTNVLQTAPRSSGDLFGHPATPDFSKTMETQVEEIMLQGEKALFAATPIGSTKWVLVVREDPREQLTPLLRARFIGAILFFSGVFIVVIGTLLTTKSMMKELIRLDRERAVSESMIIQSSKMAALGKMAAGVAHEINNPLAVIREKAGWMKDLLSDRTNGQDVDLDEFEDAVAKIESHVERARKVTHRLLGFARRMEPVRERVDLDKILGETVDLLENESKYRNIEIEVSPYNNLPRIVSDSAQVQQVFLNIINNAIDAIGKDGRIQIRTTAASKGKEVCVEISDNGSGIPKEQIGKIFDPFFTTKEVGKGTGLGLSIVYSIIEKLEGRITVDSEIGKGTTFAVYFPVK